MAGYKCKRCSTKLYSKEEKHDCVKKSSKSKVCGCAKHSAKGKEKRSERKSEHKDGCGAHKLCTTCGGWKEIPVQPQVQVPIAPLSRALVDPSPKDRALDQAQIEKLFGSPNPAFYPPKPFFDKNAFSGSWYEIARCSGSSVGDACANLIYRWMNVNDTTIQLTEMCMQANGSNVNTVAYGLPHPYDAWSYFVDRTGKYISSTGDILVDNLPYPNYVVSPNFLILGTDYKNYAVVNDRGCLRMLSRYQTISQADFDYVRGLIKYPGSAQLNHIDDGAISASAPNRVAPSN